MGIGKNNSPQNPTFRIKKVAQPIGKVQAGPSTNPSAGYVMKAQTPPATAPLTSNSNPVNTIAPTFGNKDNRLSSVANTNFVPVPNPLVDSARQKLSKVGEVTPETTKLSNINLQQSTGEGITEPTLQDFIAEAQKLGQEQVMNSVDPNFANDLARQLYGQNVGMSGLGTNVVSNALSQSLAPVAKQVGTQLGQQALSEQYAQAEENRTRKINGVFDGTIDASALSQSDWQELGITNPNAIRSLSDVDLRNAMIGEGLNPDNTEDIETYKQGLRASETKVLKDSIIKNYAEANDGRIPTTDELEMMMYLYGEGTGILTQEEENALISKYNEDQWNRTIAKANAQNPPEGKVLCTEIHRQGLLSDDIYASDALIGEYMAINDPYTVKGYHSWGIPLAKAMSKSKIITYLVLPFVRAWAKQMHHEVTGAKGSLFGKLLQGIGVPINRMIGIAISKRTMEVA